MDVNLLFKIAAVGILVTVIGQVLKHSGRTYKFWRDMCGYAEGFAVHVFAYSHVFHFGRNDALLG